MSSGVVLIGPILLAQHVWNIDPFKQMWMIPFVVVAPALHVIAIVWGHDVGDESGGD